jgi:hypothetical protein
VLPLRDRTAELRFLVGIQSLDEKTMPNGTRTTRKDGDWIKQNGEWQRVLKTKQAGKDAYAEPSKAVAPAPEPAKSASSSGAAHEIADEKEFQGLQDKLRAKLTPVEVKGALSYSQDVYMDVNRHLRGDAKYSKLDNDTASVIPALDSLLEKSKITEPLVTHRAAEFEPGSAEHELKPGDTFADKGFTSTSYRSKNIERFGNVHFVITSPPGTKIGAIPSRMAEGEMLLARGSKLRITKREEGADGHVTLHATVESQE